MKNQLKQVENNLRYIAKRNKSITFSLGLALTYLMLGINAFSQDIATTSINKEEIAMTAEKLSENLRNIKKENEKKLKGANLELVQLMEQGNQVVKSPWASWQFGMNYMYESWGGTYSGRGDKKEKYPFEGIFVRSNNVFERSTSPLSENYKELPVSTNPYSASSTQRIGLNNNYGLASTTSRQEPISVLNVDASIRPKDVYRNPIQAPTVDINAPAFQALNVSNLTPPVVDIPEPKIVEVPNKTPMVDAKPVSSYDFHQRAIEEGGSVYNDVIDGKNKTFWSGWNADNNSAEPNNSKVQIKTATGEPGLEGWRVPNVFYLNTGKRPRPTDNPSESKWLFKDATVHVRGDENATSLRVIGQIAMHTVWDGTIKNVQGYLHGYSTLISSETWHSGRVQLENVKVDVKGEYNSVFYGYPSSYFSLGVDNWDYHSYLQRGEYTGSLDVNINNANNNYVYTILGAQGAFKIKSTGKYDIKGNNNIVYLGLGYSPNWENLKGNADGGSDVNKSTMDMTPSIQLGQQHPISIDGKSNVALFFENRYGSKDIPHFDSGKGGEIGSAERWAKSIIGIYQGEIDVNANIGENSVSISNVGVYSRSGQREGIKPSEDLGSPTDTIRANVAGYPNKHPQYDFDKIHNLEVAAAKIYFGKYSTNGIMFAADRGTVIDVGKANKKNKDLTSDEANTQVTSSTEIKDSAGKLTSSFDDTNNQAATGTVIAYATGVWDNKDMPGGVAAGLKDKGSEINIYVPITMSGRAILDGGKLNPSVALIGDNKGIVNAKGSVTAKGYSSIIALAQKQGKVNVEGKITAKDEWAAKDSATKPYLYNNIGAYAGSGGTVTINGEHDIYGIGAMASGENSVVDLKGKGTIETGKGAALVATNKGVVNYHGGTIIHKEHEAGDHDGTTPLYADNSSHINFKGATQINISHGILMPGKSKDYDAKDTGTAKYNGMENVTVNLTGNNVILATNNGETTNWTGSTSGSNDVKEKMKLAALNTNGNDYKIYYINGIFNLNNNLNLDDSTDEFNRSVGLSNEKFNIAANAVVSSASGKGLAMGSNETATSNDSNSYTNNGTVNITGGSLAAGTIGFNVSYGQINNNKIISVEDGIGAYGINGSKLTNNENAKINITKQGVGMAAFTSADKLQTYGTDKNISSKTLTNSDKTFEIINKGEITVNGNKSVGLYGHTNDAKDKPAGLVLTAENGLITNSGKLILTGDETVGIVSKKAKVVLDGKGSSDIVVGKKGIGVYAEESPVTINTDYGIEVKDGGTGIFIKNDGSSLTTAAGKTLELKYSGSKTGTGLALFYEGTAGVTNTNTTDVKLVDTVNTTGGLVALYGKGGGKLINNASISGKSGYGIIAEGTEIENKKSIKFTSPIATGKASVGIYTKLSDKISNSTGGTIELGADSVGIYGHEVDQSGEIIVGDGGTAIYSEGGAVNLRAGSLTKIGANKAAAVYTKGSAQTITAHSGSKLEIGNTSFGFINEGKGNTLISNIAAQNLGTDTVYIYSNDKTGIVTNNTKLKSTASYNYGIYSSGTVTNNADIDFTVGDGNIGIYSAHGGRATNSATKRIAVGKSYIDDSNSLNNRYSIGMAAGFTPEPTDTRLPYTGTIINEGTIGATGEYSIAMYGTGKGTEVYNGTSKGSAATIELSANNTTGMYLDNGAYGYNYGTIRSVGSGLKKVVGVFVKNGSTIENHGHIEITAEDARGILAKGDIAGNNLGIIKNYGTFNINGKTDPKDPSVTFEDTDTSNLGKTMGNVSIKVPKNPPKATIEVDGKIVEPKIIDTNSSKYKEIEVSKIGMYIDTSNERFTKPIAGLSALSSLKKADLILGTEATKSTKSKYIQIGKKILDPYNKMILNNPQVEKWNIYSGSLTWMGEITQNQTTGVIENAYLAKVPYTEWAGKEPSPVDRKDTFNFLDGLEQRYGVEELGSRENQLFQKLNSIGKNEEILFFQAVDEMMGHQYANIQQRIHSTGQILDKEFDYLKDEWRTASKDSNKIKVFGMKGEYSTDTAGIIDYKNNAYGVAYVGENETLKLGKSSGWYTGLVHNKFDFKDIGNSKEEMLQAKLGLFKSVAFDDNNSLNWTISGEAFAGYNKMHRKFLVVDEIFNARSKYWSYGLALKNELSKTFRLSEDFSLRGYGSIKAEYGRFQKIDEKSGEMRLEIKANDYISIKPEIGGELIYKTPLSGRNFFNAKLGVKYENELGRVANAKNKARVAHTNADWFNIRGEKEDRRGSVGADLSLGLDNERYGITASIGYDTKGKNKKAGLGLRVIF